jgi:hypothetical protein
MAYIKGEYSSNSIIIEGKRTLVQNQITACWNNYKETNSMVLELWQGNTISIHSINHQ